MLWVTQLDLPTIGHFMFILMSHRLHSYDVVEIPNIKIFYDLDQTLLIDHPLYILAPSNWSDVNLR